MAPHATAKPKACVEAQGLEANFKTVGLHTLRNLRGPVLRHSSLCVRIMAPTDDALTVVGNLLAVESNEKKLKRKLGIKDCLQKRKVYFNVNLLK